jgi:hypothetical protein
MSSPQRTNSAGFAAKSLLSLSVAVLAGCASAGTSGVGSVSQASSSDMSWMAAIPAPSPDPRVGLKAGVYDAQEAAWNMRVVSRTKPSEKFIGGTNSDLAFRGNHVIQGNYNGYQVWDISNPAAPTLAFANYCPASQSDVSTYKNLLFVSAEGNTGRIDCGNQGVKDTVSTDRIRGVRIFDITDIAHPRNVANVQTCRGSHTHTVLVDPKDPDNVYVYVSGSAGVRNPLEMKGCVKDSKDPNYSQFRIEAIKVPLAHPEQAAIVTQPRIFQGLAQVHSHGMAPDDKTAFEKAKANGGFVADIFGTAQVLPPNFIRPQLDSIHRCRLDSAAQWPAGAHQQDDRRTGDAEPGSPGRQLLPRHHGLPGHGSRRRCMRRLRPPARHQGSREPDAYRRGQRHQLLVLALRHVQQRRYQAAVLR